MRMFDLSLELMSLLYEAVSHTTNLCSIPMQLQSLASVGKQNQLQCKPCNMAAVQNRLMLCQ